LYARPEAQYVHHIAREAELCKRVTAIVLKMYLKFILTQSINKEIKKQSNTIYNYRKLFFFCIKWQKYMFFSVFKI